MTCPHCQSPAVEATLHAVFRRAGRELIPVPALVEVEVACSECGQAVADEESEALVRERFPELFEEK